METVSRCTGSLESARRNPEMVNSSENSPNPPVRRLSTVTWKLSNCSEAFRGRSSYCALSDFRDLIPSPTVSNCCFHCVFRCYWFSTGLYWVILVSWGFYQVLLYFFFRAFPIIWWKEETTHLIECWAWPCNRRKRLFAACWWGCRPVSRSEGDTPFPGRALVGSPRNWFATRSMVQWKTTNRMEA